MARRRHVWTALRAPHRTDPADVHAALSALGELGPRATTDAVAAGVGRWVGAVRATLHALEGAGAVELDLEDGTPGTGRPAKDAAAVLRDALAALEGARHAVESARDALTRAERAVKRALEKTETTKAP